MTTMSAHTAETSAPDGGGAELRKTIATRLAHVRARIATAAARAGRSAQAVSLVAVSKGFEPEHVRAAIAAGQRDFGENRLQALETKVAALGQGAARWHFVGRLQRNKVKSVVRLAALIHSVDRPELVSEIASRAATAGRIQPVLVQVNVGDDSAKGGCSPDDLDELLHLVRDTDGITCQGLMTVPPMQEDPRPLFQTLRQLRDDVQRAFPEVRHLSMGMSSDFEVAVEEGATIVRLGEAIFGPRPAA